MQKYLIFLQNFNAKILKSLNPWIIFLYYAKLILKLIKLIKKLKFRRFAFILLKIILAEILGKKRLYFLLKKIKLILSRIYLVRFKIKNVGITIVSFLIFLITVNVQIALCVLNITMAKFWLNKKNN